MANTTGSFFRVFHSLVMKKLECRNAGTDATCPDSFLLAKSPEPQEFLLDLQGALNSKAPLVVGMAGRFSSTIIRDMVVMRGDR